ncbi:hypothetical protein B0H21DRAFT_761172 [Amylocystis lapponica]|nr:hypothetical protein B0H21DRAFT_761172 [Amylocystis lapponica]
MDSTPIDQFQLAQAFAGDIVHHNYLNWEGPFYVLWTRALSHLFPADKHERIYPSPQLPLHKVQVTNDGLNKRKSTIPDFCLLYLGGKRAAQPGTNNIALVCDFPVMRDHFRGKFEVITATILAICEVKRLPDFPDKGLSKEAYSTKMNVNYRLRFREASEDAERQCRLYFSAYRNVIGVVVMALVGNRFSWASIERSAISDMSSNVDSTYHPSDGDSSGPHVSITRPAAADGESILRGGPKKNYKDSSSSDSDYDDDVNDWPDHMKKKRQAMLQRGRDIQSQLPQRTSAQSTGVDIVASSSGAGAEDKGKARSSEGSSPPPVRVTRAMSRQHTPAATGTAVRSDTPKVGPSTQAGPSGSRSSRVAPQPVGDPPVDEINLRGLWSEPVPWDEPEGEIEKEKMMDEIRRWNEGLDI